MDEIEWFDAEQRAWARARYMLAVFGVALPSPGFPTALTEEEPDEGWNSTGGVEVLYSHNHTSLRFLDPFRIVEHPTFAKQVYPDLDLSVSKYRWSASASSLLRTEALEQ